MRVVVSNREVYREWVRRGRGHARNASGSCSYRDSVAFSYNAPIGYQIANNRPGSYESLYFVTDRQYSVTTSKHVSLLVQAIPVGRIVVVPDLDAALGWNRSRQCAPPFGEAVVAQLLARLPAMLERQKRARSRKRAFTAECETARIELVRVCAFFDLRVPDAPILAEIDALPSVPMIAPRRRGR